MTAMIDSQPVRNAPTTGAEDAGEQAEMRAARTRLVST